MESERRVLAPITVLHLSEEERIWLNKLVQNSMCGPHDEDPRDAEMRKKFWDATNYSRVEEPTNV